MKKTAALALILIFLLTLPLQSCRKPSAPVPSETAGSAPSETTALSSEAGTTAAPDTVGTEPETAPDTTAPTQAAEPSEDALIRYQNGGTRDYLPDEPVAMVDFAEMRYTRPDVEALYRDFDALTREAGTSSDADALLEGYYDVFNRYTDFYTMDTLANIRYSLNTTDTYYQDEYDFCQAESPNLEEKLEALNKAFAASPVRNTLEEKYFGDGYFRTYDDYEVYTNETYLELSRQEQAILSEYRALLQDPQIEFEGKQQSFWELMEDQSNYTRYLGALQAYYTQYNPKVGEKYLELIRIRKQLAAALDYDSYADYSYEVSYSRDYTPEQGTAFVQAIREDLVPLYAKLAASGQLYLSSAGSAKEEQVRAMVQRAAEIIGGSVLDAYRFMEAYHLSDITKAAEKTDASFETYLHTYEAPFVFVNSTGTSSDYTTFAHEFGHFTDAYHNYNAEEDLETAETFSQAMEFLALCYSDTLSDAARTRLLKHQLMDVLETFVSQAAFASFEEQVYALPEEELTLDRINDLYLQVNRDFGFAEPGFEFYYSQSWIDVMHFFEAPYYVISYCVSADTSLQVYRLEAAKAGTGVDAYFRLLDRSYGAGVQQVMKDAGLENPFDAKSMKNTAEFFRQQLKLK